MVPEMDKATETALSGVRSGGRLGHLAMKHGTYYDF
jgi:hypothetical protein